MAHRRRHHGTLPGRLLHRSHEAAARGPTGRERELERLPAEAVFERLGTTPLGLTTDEADRRLRDHGPNVVARVHRFARLRLLGRALRDPLVLLLTLLATLSSLTGDPRAAVTMALMIALSIGLRLRQEGRASAAAARLRGLLSVKATVLRDGAAVDCDVTHLVRGDVVLLGAGDMIPADVRLVRAKDLFLVESALTGESFPVEKFAEAVDALRGSVLDARTLAFLGSSVASGSATAVVVATGAETYLGGMADVLESPPPPSAFDLGLARFTRAMLVTMAVMAPLVFALNGLTKGRWDEAFLFALAVAVGLTPEMLPMVVTLCLARGALAMARRRVVVKRLHAIEDLGAMDVLCTDKTGTLTRGEIVLERHCDMALRESAEVLELAYVNSHFQTGLRSVLDRAVLAHQEPHVLERVQRLTKVDEIPFDFERRMMSVVVRAPDGRDRLVAKGAPEAVFGRSSAYRLDGRVRSLDEERLVSLRREHETLASQGFRVLALATREFESGRRGDEKARSYGPADEAGLVLEGYLAFLDPPKESAAEALRALASHGVRVKVITGDDVLVSRKVCRDVGLDPGTVVLGRDVERLSDDELAQVVEETGLFARVSPVHKQRIVLALKARGHVVGFLGDGINDAPALHAADVGISVDSAVDIAREAAGVILLERSLLVLDEGVLEGRRVFANVLKYLRMGASSSFGNVLSVVGASALLPFLPMRPIHVLVNNLLYDLGQAAIPSDAVDLEEVIAPRRWNVAELVRHTAVLGPCSSLFDYATYGVLLGVFGCDDVSTASAAERSERLFQTGWFVESLLSQALVVHVIRTRKRPIADSRSSSQLALATALVAAVGLALPSSRFGRSLGFVPLPTAFWPWLAAILVGYLAAVQAAKRATVRRAAE